MLWLGHRPPPCCSQGHVREDRGRSKSAGMRGVSDRDRACGAGEASTWQGGWAGDRAGEKEAWPRGRRDVRPEVAGGWPWSRV